MFPPIRKIALSVCLVLLLGLVVPAWTASVKASSLNAETTSSLVEPVAKAISGTRKFLLGRVEGMKQKEVAVRNHLGGRVAIGAVRG